MILSDLLEANRYKWQQDTQEEILNDLLCKSHKYKSQGTNSEKLVMVFGKSHSGKTTFILSLLGIRDEKLSELNHILRAGIPEGKSSTSTAIIYQKSDDNNFGICEHIIDDLNQYQITKYTAEEFIKQLQLIRLSVETGKRNCETVLYLYIPQSYFDENSNNKNNINILDVPGYETTNVDEQKHTNALLNKYMSFSVLNIIVRSIYDINDLRYFYAPNRDDYTKLISRKYIIVTTRSYSQESIFNYFKTPYEERTETFEERLINECTIQFENIFGKEIPTFFPIDIGESFNELINHKIQLPSDREYIIDFRKRVFNSIYECIYNRQNNTLLNWVKEVIADEEYYGKIESTLVDEAIKKINLDLEATQKLIQKKKKQLEDLEINYEIEAELQENLISKKNSIKFFELKDSINKAINLRKEDLFTSDYKWKCSKEYQDASAMFAFLFSEFLTTQFKNLIETYELISEKTKQNWFKILKDEELQIRSNLNSAMNTHKVLKFFNPSNKEKIELGRNKLQEAIPRLLTKCIEDIKSEYNSEISQIRKQKNNFSILIKESKRKIAELDSTVKILEKQRESLENEKRSIHARVQTDKAILAQFKIIADKNFMIQKNEILREINDVNSKEDKMKSLILLGLIEKDFNKIKTG